jgi:hypothetical protein
MRPLNSSAGKPFKSGRREGYEFYHAVLAEKIG